MLLLLIQRNIANGQSFQCYFNKNLIIIPEKFLRNSMQYPYYINEKKQSRKRLKALLVHGICEMIEQNVFCPALYSAQYTTLNHNKNNFTGDILTICGGTLCLRI